MGAATRRYRVLDEFDLVDVGFVKIDVEGHELPVLLGSAELIDRERPNVLVEIEDAHHSGDEIEDVFSFFAQRGYSGTFFAQKKWFPLSDFDRDKAQRAGEFAKSTGMLRSTVMSSDRYIHNFLFRPPAS